MQGKKSFPGEDLKKLVGEKFGSSAKKKKAVTAIAIP